MQAILITTVFAMMSMLQPPLTWLLTYVSGGAIALVTLQVGIKQGLAVSAGAALGSGLMAMLMMGTPIVAMVFVLVLWLPVWMTALVLAYSRSLGLSVQLSTLIGMAVVVLFYLVSGDPASMWQGMLNDITQDIAQTGSLTQSQLEELNQLVQVLAPLMTGSFAGSLVIGLVISLFIGRGWQALLYRPGAFADEFSRLRFERLTGIVMLVLVGLALLGGYGAAINIAIVLGVAYMFYGLGVVHGLVKGRAGASRWLFVLYVLLAVLTPHVALILILLGWMDTWVGFRERFALRPGP